MSQCDPGSRSGNRGHPAIMTGLIPFLNGTTQPESNQLQHLTIRAPHGQAHFQLVVTHIEVRWRQLMGLPDKA